MPRPLSPLLVAWLELCATSGRRSLTSGAALETGTSEQRDAVALALVALGYPEAMASPRAMGASLRALRGLRDGQGRYLDRSAVRGGSIWYVTGGMAGTVEVRVLGETAPR